MQKRHTDRKMYFHDLEITSKEFYVSYLSTFKKLTSKSRVLEVGCGEGGNLVPFAQLGCRVTGIDIAECRRLNDKNRSLCFPASKKCRKTRAFFYYEYSF